MSNEIRLTFSLEVNKDHFKFRSGQINNQHDLVGEPKQTGSTMDLTTEWQGLEVGQDMGQPGWSIFTNLSDVATIEVGSQAISCEEVSPFLSLEPGESCPCPLATLDLFARSTTSTAPLDFRIMGR